MTYEKVMGMVRTSRAATVMAGAAALLALTLAAQAAALQVTVTDKASGAAISKATVALVVGGNVVAAGRTDGSGAWTGPAVSAEGWVVVDKKLYAPVARQVSAGQGTLGVALEGLAPEQFKSLGRIVGFVKSAAGQPLSNATLLMMRDGKPVGVTQTQNASGVYELEWYPPGTYTVVGTAPGYVNRSYSGLQVTAGQALWLEVTLQPR